MIVQTPKQWKKNTLLALRSKQLSWRTVFYLCISSVFPLHHYRETKQCMVMGSFLEWIDREGLLRRICFRISSAPVNLLICLLFITSYRKCKISVKPERLNSTQTHSDISCEAWGSVSFGVHVPQGCRWGYQWDKCSYLLPFLLLFSWDTGAWRVQCGC